MAKVMSTKAAGHSRATSYTFSVVVEPDEDAWHAWCPALQGYGAATWGASREEALRHIREVVAMVVAELVEDGEAVPADLPVAEGTVIAVSVRARSTGRGCGRSPRAP